MGLKLFSKYYSEILIEVIKLEFGKGPLSKGDFREFLKCHKSSFRRYGFSYSNFLTQTWARLFEALKNWKEGKSSPLPLKAWISGSIDIRIFANPNVGRGYFYNLPPSLS